MIHPVLELEERFWRAAGDPEFYQEHFADDGVIAFHIGVLDKTAVVESMRGASEWATFSIDHPRIVQVSDDVVSLTYRATATTVDDDRYAAYVTSVYAERDGAWQLIVHHQTPAAEADNA